MDTEGPAEVECPAEVARQDRGYGVVERKRIQSVWNPCFRTRHEEAADKRSAGAECAAESSLLRGCARQARPRIGWQGPDIDKR